MTPDYFDRRLISKLPRAAVISVGPVGPRGY